MSGKSLLIVESPGKIKKIQSYVGPDYIVAASIGHIRGLPAKQLGIDIDNNYEPTFIINSDKADVVKKLRALSKENNGPVYLCSDPDREGEAISFHVKETLNLTQDRIRRASFNKITKAAILSALKKPTDIDMNMVHSQFARAILDKLIGFGVSPLLWKQFANNHLSAGRVQSVVAKLIIEREDEISSFKTSNYFNLDGKFSFIVNGSNSKDNNGNNDNNIEQHKIKKSELVKASCDINIPDYSIIENIYELNKSGEAKYSVESVKKSNTKRKPSPPYDTCTLQQDASNKLGMSPDICMKNAQKLYEAGLITYMRTDSLMIDEGALVAIGEYIKGRWGDEYHNKTYYKTKDASAQEAHEAIRVIDPKITSVSGQDGMTSTHERLYQIIWRRTIACQMSAADVEIKTVKIKLDNPIKFITPTPDITSNPIPDITLTPIPDTTPDITPNELESEKTTKTGKKIIKKLVITPRKKLAVNPDMNEKILTFSAKHELILFPGFLVVYEKAGKSATNSSEISDISGINEISEDNDANSNSGDDDDNDDSSSGLVSETLGKLFDKLENGQSVKCYSLLADERISRPPHPRYTEASMVKQLKQLKIGRPATFATMVAKVQERTYAEIKSITGQTVNLRISEFIYPDNISSKTVESTTGSDNKKLMPTQLGRMINDFLIEKFAEFMDYTFTARVETMLDEIASGSLNWVDVVDTVYKTIKPTIDELGTALAIAAKAARAADKSDPTPKYSQYDTILGENPVSGRTVAITQTRLGYAICERHPTDKKQHKYAGFSGSPDNITLKYALSLLVFPKNLGEYNGEPLQICRGKSVYLKHGERNFSIDIFNKEFPSHIINDAANMSLEQAINLVKLTIDKNIAVAGGAGDINLSSDIIIKTVGKYGPYIKFKGEHNVALGKPIIKKYDGDLSKITIDDCNALIAKFMAKKSAAGDSTSGSTSGITLLDKFKSGAKPAPAKSRAKSAAAKSATTTGAKSAAAKSAATIGAKPAAKPRAKSAATNNEDTEKSEKPKRTYKKKITE